MAARAPTCGRRIVGQPAFGRNPLLDEARHRRGGGGVELPRNPPGVRGEPAGFDGQLHGPRHADGVLGLGHGGVHEDPLRSQLHGQGGVARGAHASVHDHRDLGLLQDDPQVGGVADAHPRADGGPQGHHGRGSGLLQLAADHRVVVRVRQDRKSFRHQLFGRAEKLDVVGEKGLLVPDHLQLHPVPAPQLAGQAGGADGLVGGVAAGGVGQQQVPLGIDEVQQRALAPLAQIHPAQGHGDHLGARGLQGGGHGRKVRIFARAQEQARAEGAAGDGERLDL